jgi:S-adenosylhomocysteine hydrolase
MAITIVRAIRSLRIRPRRYAVFGFGKKENPDRQAFREEFEHTVARMRTADDVVQVAVGNAINMANSAFRSAHGTPAAFLSLPKAEQHAYIAKLTEMETKLKDEMHDAPSSLGFGLFKMWIGTLAAGDNALMEKFAKELAHFSRKGNLP